MEGRTPDQFGLSRLKEGERVCGAAWNVSARSGAPVVEVKSKLRREIEDVIALIESRCQARPTPMEFEMAYQARVAIDRIRFAIKHTERFAPYTDQMREAGFQLLDALERLESVDRRFQRRARLTPTAREDSLTNASAGPDVSGDRSPHRLNGRAENTSEHPVE